MTNLSRLPPMPPYAAEMVESTEKAGGAVLVFDGSDRIVAANEEQRRIMPCCDYGPGDTYTTFFWGAHARGMTGNKEASRDPSTWLAAAIATRRSSPNLDFVNHYPWGRMLVSHVRLEDGTSIQARLDIHKSGVARLFGERDAGLGVLWAIRVRREIQRLQAALDNLSLGVALLEDGGADGACLIHSNASFGDLLSGRDGLVLDENRRLLAVDEGDQMSLSQALDDALGGRARTGYVPIRRPGKQPLVLAVSAGETPGTALVTVARFGEDEPEIVGTLMQAFGLPAVQAEVLAALGSGLTVEEIAQRRRVAKGTTYLQVNQIKKSLKEFGFSVVDIAGMASIVSKISSVISTRKSRIFKRKHTHTNDL